MGEQSAIRGPSSPRQSSGPLRQPDPLAFAPRGPVIDRPRRKWLQSLPSDTGSLERGARAGASFGGLEGRQKQQPDNHQPSALHRHAAAPLDARDMLSSDNNNIPYLAKGM